MDWASTAIIVALIIVIWAKVSHKTVPELIKEIIEVIKGAKEDSADYATEVIDYN